MKKKTSKKAVKDHSDIIGTEFFKMIQNLRKKGVTDDISTLTIFSMCANKLVEMYSLKQATILFLNCVKCG